MYFRCRSFPDFAKVSVCGESADRGYSVLIFPEGEVNNSEDGKMVAFQPGIGILAQNLGLPIIPMRLDGVWGMKRERRRLGASRRDYGTHRPAYLSSTGVSKDELAQRLYLLVKSL